MNFKTKTVNLKPTTYPRCLNAARNIVPTTLSYINKDRNEAGRPLEQKIEEHAMGKLGECGMVVLAHLNKKKYTAPDFEVVKNKSFNRDLFIDNKKIHVKCQPAWSLGWTMRKKGCPSWSCEKTDRLVFNPDENDYIALFSEVNKTTLNYYGMIQARKLINKWGPAISPKLKTKACLYLSDFKDEMTLEL